MYPKSLDHFRAAVLLNSKDVKTSTVYTASGWFNHKGKATFISNYCAIDRDGVNQSVETQIESKQLQPYSLELFDNEADEKNRLASVFKCLDVGPINAATLLFLAAIRALFASIVPANFSVFVEGNTGAKKSSLAAVYLNFFGRCFTNNNLPGNFISTGNSIEKLAYDARDVILVIDDYDSIEHQAILARLLRSQGNNSARLRLRSDGSSNKTYYSRCLPVITGEVLPYGHSANARMLITEIKKNEVDCEKLSALQSLARDGVFAKCHGSFIKWMADKIHYFKDYYDQRFVVLRDHYQNELLHSRAPEIAASLLITFDIYLSFLDSKDIFSDSEMTKHWRNVTKTVSDTLIEQASHLSRLDPADRAMSMLRFLLRSRSIHFADQKSTGTPFTNNSKTSIFYPSLWGWKSDEPNVWTTSNSKLVGYVSEKEVMLDLDLAFPILDRFAASEQEPLRINKHALKKQMASQGYLKIEGNHYSKKRKIGGSGSARFLCFSDHGLFLHTPEDQDTTDFTFPNPERLDFLTFISNAKGGAKK